MFNTMDNIVNEFYSSTPGIKSIGNEYEIELTFTCKKTLSIPEYENIDEYIDNYIDTECDIDISDMDIDYTISGKHEYYYL